MIKLIRSFIFLTLFGWTSTYAQDIQFTHLPSKKGASIEVLKFYISSIIVTYEDGTKLIEENSYHLINFEERSTTLLHLSEKDKKPIKAISFNIGTDSLVNVSGILDGDLDPILGMYWAWNTGYINVKMEGLVNQQKFEYHIGGYLNPFPTVRHNSYVLKRPTTDKISFIIDTDLMLSQLDVEAMPEAMIPGEQASKLATLFSNCIYLDE